MSKKVVETIVNIMPTDIVNAGPKGLDCSIAHMYSVFTMWFSIIIFLVFYHGLKHDVYLFCSVFHNQKKKNEDSNIKDIATEQYLQGVLAIKNYRSLGIAEPW